LSDGKQTAWIGVARFRVTGTERKATPKRRMVEILPGDIVLRGAHRLYDRTGYERKRIKATKA
jgi:hypothetical protein